jgi:acyl-CoA thioester hydrolase
LKHEIDVNVRFSETDALGHINNISYFIYMEEARLKFIEALGYDMDVSQWHFILASTKCDFVDQGYFNQVLKITTAVSKIGTKSFHLNHEILDSATGKLIAKGEAVMVYFNFEKQKSEQLPEILRVELERHLAKS